MTLERQLRRWTDAGIIDAVTADRIRAHEATGRRPLLVYALTGLGTLTIIIGLVSIVAANWDGIGPWTKLGVDLVVGMLLAVATARAVGGGPRWAADVLVVLYYGFTLASFALVGQVYQTTAPTYRVLLLWTGATLPLVLLARSSWAAWIVSAGWICTHASTLKYLAMRWEPSADVIATLGFASPLLWLGAAALPGMRRERPAFAAVMAQVALLAVAAGGFAVTLAWYSTVSNVDRVTWGYLVCLALAVLTWMVAPTHVRRPIGGTVVLAWVLMIVSTSFEREAVPLVGALLQIGWLGWLAFASLELGSVRHFHTCTGLIALRLLVVYSEVFGSLLDTGLGMIIGGMLTLAIAWFWRSRSTAFAEEWMARRGDGSDA